MAGTRSGFDVVAVRDTPSGGWKSHRIISEELLDLAWERLARYKIPCAIGLHPALPRHPTGKLPVRLLASPSGRIEYGASGDHEEYIVTPHSVTDSGAGS